MSDAIGHELVPDPLGTPPDDRQLLSPLLARTTTVRRPVGPVGYDCVKLIVVRDGSAFLFSEFGQQAVKSGDVVLLGANVLCGSEPEGHISVTTLYLDTDYVLDQLRWQYAAFLHDRLDAQGFAETIYTEPAQILRLGEDRAGMLMPWLDEMVRLSVDRHPVRHYLRMQALWFQVAYVIAPFIKVSPVRLSSSQRAHIRPTLLHPAGVPVGIAEQLVADCYRDISITEEQYAALAAQVEQRSMNGTPPARRNWAS